MINYITIPQNTTIYRADSHIVKNPVSTVCADTGKTGVYFCMGNPYLEESRCTERMQNQVISIYTINKPITVSVGKYGFTRGYSAPYTTAGWTSVNDDDNIAHYDDKIGPLDFNIIDASFDNGELFLTNKELDNVVFVDYYTITVGECIRKWYKQSWFETMVEKYVKSFSDPLNKHYTRYTAVNDDIGYKRMEL